MNWKRDRSAPDRLSRSGRQWGGAGWGGEVAEFSMAGLRSGTKRQTD